jgi:hypothetical protein
VLPFSTRTSGIILTIIGFVIAILAGLIIATQANVWGASGILAAGAIAFVVAGVPMLAGLYLYARSATAAQELNTEMLHQRPLMDMLKTHPSTTLAHLASQLHISEAEAQDIVAGLGRLQVFTGYLTPTGTVQQLEGAVLLALTHCQHCGTPLKIQAVATPCITCGTEYYPPESPNKWG